MTWLRAGLLAALLWGCSALVPTGVCAHEEDTQEDIQLLHDAAAALQQSHPDLAERLNQYADREARQLDEAEGETGTDEAGEFHEDEDARPGHEHR